jgi:S-(hydroxymethyl)glutathione dehydrogenase / alcohol dehydrogenase
MPDERAPADGPAVKAAVLREFGAPLELDDVELDPPKAHEVRVRVEATSICRSDISCCDGGFPVYGLPMIPGHEAAGTVVEVGGQVGTLGAGARVVISWNSSCGTCWHCQRGESIYCLGIRSRFGLQHDGTSRLRLRGQPLVRGMDAGTFCQENIFHENALLPVDSRLDAAQASLLGCTVPTGVGAVRNVAGVSPGDRVAVIGCGAVGLCAIQAAAKAGADVVIGIDTTSERARVAGQLGATTALCPAGTAEIVSAVNDLTGGIGVDYAIETAGSHQTIMLAIDIVRRGGSVVVVGNPPPYEPMQIFPGLLPLTGKRLLGCCFGGSRLQEEIPQLGLEAVAGVLQLAPLLTHRVPLAEVNSALELLREGAALRPVLYP